MGDQHEQLATAATVAQLFGVTPATVRRWVRERRVPCIRVSRRVLRFNLADIEKTVAQRAKRNGE